MLKLDKKGDRFWCNENGQLHRIDGPAIEMNNGKKCWYLEGIKYTESQYKKKVKEYVRD